MSTTPASDTPATPLTDRLRAFLAPARVASIASTSPDGSPRISVTWFRLLDDDRILVNSLVGRTWERNLRRTGRVSISVLDPGNPWSWLGLTGVVDAIDDDLERGRDDIVSLAHRYAPDGTPDPGMVARFRSQQRVTFRIRVTGVHDHVEA